MVNRDLATMAAMMPTAVEMTSSTKRALKMDASLAAVTPVAIAVVPVSEYSDDGKFYDSPSAVWYERAVVKVGEMQASPVEDSDELDGYQVEIVSIYGDTGIGYPGLVGVMAQEEGDIGIMGTQGACQGICPSDNIPSYLSELPGTKDRSSSEWGNYEADDGSIMVYIPRFYYKIGTGANGLAVNTIDIKSQYYFADTAAANADGYALPRAFINGGVEKDGVFVDKYLCSKNALGAGFAASSIALGNPISTNASHNPIADLTACATNAYFECVTAAKARDGVDGAVNASSIFFCNTRFIRSAIAILSMAHGQAATSATYCAWYDSAGVTNFPKGCNNNALGDTNDGAVTFTSDGYSNAAKTGSGSPFAKTTHNGQACGITDLNGNMWELELGLTRPGASATDSAAQSDTAAFYVLKESVAIEDLTAGWNTGSDAWGDASHLATLYDAIDLSHIGATTGWVDFGNGANQVLHEDVVGDDYKMTSLGIYRDGGQSASGTNLYGQDGLYQYHRANLAVVSGGDWGNGSDAGLWACYLNYWRSLSGTAIGFRCACYPV